MRWVVVCALLLVVPAAAQPTPGEETHAPIRIESSTDFNPANGVRKGTGTEADPYIISGYRISRPLLSLDPPPAIHISGTQAHVVFQDLVAAGFSLGIEILDARNVTVDDVRFVDVGRGLDVRRSSDLLLSRIEVERSGPDEFAAGMVVQDSQRIVVQEARFNDGNGDGVLLTNDRFVRLVGLDVREHQHGLRIQGGSDIDVFGATVVDNRGDGVWVVNADRVQVFGLDARAQQGRGLVLGQSDVVVRDLLAKDNGGGVRIFDGTVRLVGARVLDNGGAGLLAASPNLQVSGIEAHGNAGPGIHLFRPIEGTAFARIEGAQLHDNRAGVLVQDLDGLHLEGIHAGFNAGVGIDVRATHNATLLRSSANHNDGHGVQFIEVEGGQIRDTEGASNHGHGFSLRRVADLNVRHNVAAENGRSGFLLEGPRLVVADNEANRNGDFGFEILPGALDAMMQGNRIQENRLGDVQERTDEHNTPLAPWALIAALVVAARLTSSSREGR